MSLTPQQLSMLAQVVAQAPDGALPALMVGVPGAAGAEIGRLAGAEMRRRKAKAAVLGLIQAAQGSPATAAPVPPAALTRLWAALQAHDPELVKAACEAEGAAAADELCRTGAQLLQIDEGLKRELEALQPGCAARLVLQLEMTPLLRLVAGEELQGWVLRATPQRAAHARMVFKDVDALGDGAGPMMLELLSGQLAEPWSVLRLLPLLTPQQSESYVRASELGALCERLLAVGDQNLRRLAGGALADEQESVSLAEAATAVASALTELESSVTLNPQGAWGARAKEQRRKLADAVEQRLREVDGLLAKALPQHVVRFAGRMTRRQPHLEKAPDPRHAQRALALLRFAHELREGAPAGGYNSMLTRVLAEAVERLELYVEEVLALMHAPGEDAEAGRRQLDLAARLMAYAQDDRAAEVVRRRAQAA